MQKDFSKLTRSIQILPTDIEKILHKNGVMNDYNRRPVYQQNDYMVGLKEPKEKKLKIKD